MLFRSMVINQVHCMKLSLISSSGSSLLVYPESDFTTTLMLYVSKTARPGLNLDKFMKAEGKS